MSLSVITNDEKKAIQALRNALEKHPVFAELKDEYLGHTAMYDDYLCVRFLRARNLEIDKTLDMITKSMKWRHDEKVDDIWKEKFECYSALKQIYISALHGFDNEGRAVYYEKVGRLNLKKVKSVTDVKTLVRLHIALNEYILRTLNVHASQHAHHRIFQITNVFDLKGLDAHMFTKEVFGYLQTISQIDSDNYPESLGQFYLINSPWAFSQAWKIIRTFLDKKTASKFKILKGPKEYKKVLLASVDPKVVPVEYGGTCNCNKPGCFQMSEEEREYADYVLTDEHHPADDEAAELVKQEHQLEEKLAPLQVTTPSQASASTQTTTNKATATITRTETQTTTITVTYNELPHDKLQNHPRTV